MTADVGKAAETEKEPLVSGETIILDYKEGKFGGLATYNKMCKAIDLMERWKPEAVAEFLEQFVDIGELLDSKCKVFVEKLAHLPLHIVPLSIRQRHVEMLQSIAVQHICHTEAVLEGFVEHFIAIVRPVAPLVKVEGNENVVEGLPKIELALSAEDQKAIYETAHCAVAFVVRCLPMSLKLLEKVLRQKFPHRTVPYLRYESYVRNIFLLSENISDIRARVWSLIIENLAQIDTVFSRRIDKGDTNEDSEISNDSSAIFLMDDENDPLRFGSLKEDEHCNDGEQKLDACLCYAFAVIAKSHGALIPPDIASCVDWIPDCCSNEGLYMLIRAAFGEHILLAHHLKHVSFLSFYLCSLDRTYTTNFMQWLWSFVVRPSQSPGDWKKAHGAACYLGSFLSRASFIDLRQCMDWMERLMRWCTRYVNETVGGCASVSVGTLRHGTFYAVCQALLVTFAFRYREIVDANELDSVRQWSIGHVIHCSLEPLRYISRPVALCFATISRCLQLVYCNHVLPPISTEEKTPFEPYFPFDSYNLPRSSQFLKSLTRRFSPLAEDVGVLARELRWHNASSLSGAMGFRNSDEAAGSLDFLDDLARDRDLVDEDAVTSYGSLKSPRAVDVFTIYSASPGLKHFEAPPSYMDTM